ncbi:MAG TPA: DUF5916 domain-containing protein [Chitinophagaceae bacterium]|nr:DUF5916 domain-containing protein [Chitinophagaceae bacterium]
MRNIPLICLFALCFHVAFSQTAKQVPAVRTTLPIKIDGDLKDEAWRSAPLIAGLVEQRPVFGRQEDEQNKTQVYLLYDDNFIYFGGILREHKDSISTELAGRDNIGVNDFVGVVFDTYRDRINGLGFFVTPLGEQFDVKYTIGNEDGSWNAVYDTETKITSEGWTFEMRIPYSAIRFSKEKIQNWGMHILRRRSKSGRQLSWSPIDPTKFGFMNQAGNWTNLENIKPPIRLSFSPYLSTYLTRNPGANENWETSINGGMDLKYGISDGFTMDMTLIPDFGQVQSDNQVLNLTPFEVRFNENRSFFNEGTELFNKGNLFYSRRIGGTPIHYYDIYGRVDSTETIVKNPSETKLINATKISGRTRKKLGIGFFNAITKAQFATVENSVKEHHKVETNPLTNYNVLVLDQAMKNNSSVTLVNTNVWRSGKDYDANVTAVLWDLYDKNVDWNVWGQVTHSRLIGFEALGKTLAGYHYNAFVGKFKGRFNFDIHRFFADEKYDQRDMGYFTNNNYLTHGFYAGYKWIKPKSFYNNIYLNINGNYSEMYKPRRFQYLRINGNVNGQLKNLWQVGINGDIRPENQDFYEPRKNGSKVKLPASWMTGFWVNTNRAKKYSASLEMYHRTSRKYRSHSTDLYIGNNYRFNDKFSVGVSTYMEVYNRNLGFAYIPNARDEVVFGLRDRRTVENVLNVKYNFNNKMGLTFRLRHYWSKVHYTEFFELQDDGYVKGMPVGTAVENPDNNVNFFNIDMNYTWQFAPGSFLNAGWKSASQLFDQLVQERYYHNFRNTLDEPKQNILSIKVIYYLDYLNLQRKRLRKT